MLRIDVDRADVDPKEWVRLLQVDAEDARGARQSRDQREAGLQPAGPFTLPQDYLLAAGCEARYGSRGIDMNHQVHRSHGMVAAQSVGRTFQAQRRAAVAD